MIRKLILPLAVAILATAVPGCKAGQANNVGSLPPKSAASVVSRSPGSAASVASQSPKGSEDFIPLSFPEGKGASDAERTISSITKAEGADNLYLMTYYGNYENIVSESSAADLGTSVPAGCTLLSMTGNKNAPIYGRNFDNPPGTGAVLARYRPQNRYSSIVFSRMNDLGLSAGFNREKLSDTQKKAILKAPYYALDGINEKGFAVALAYNPPGISTAGFKGEKVFITELMRKLLDNAADVDDAIKICRGSKAYDFGENTLTHHFLIADSKANAVTVEFGNGSWQFMKSDVPYQAVTNFPLYNVGEEQRRGSCWRYNRAEALMSGMQGKGGWKDLLHVLQKVAQSGQAQTIWSYSADLSAKTIYLCMNGNYSNIYNVSFR